MYKFLAFIFSLTIFLLSNSLVSAATNSFVSVINPIRGSDFWDLNNQKVEEAVLGQKQILKKYNISATWLMRFDALNYETVVSLLKSDSSDEVGLFLEVTPTWTKNANVDYHKSENWHDAGSAFLSGYERGEREKLIDTAFEKFEQVFGYYPKSVGTWWIDAYSLSYMEQKYGITASLIVADQYTTDKYQIWGQYFSTPYYPSKNHILRPAQTLENKIPVVVVQWAARDPINGYGDGVEESTYSVQANDYTDYHKLDTSYFSSLVDIYTTQQFNKFGHLVVGLENSYDWNKYSNEYQKQIKALAEKTDTGKLSIVPMKDFASWYQRTFPKLSPEHLILASDPLGTDKKVIWFMNPYYRAGWFANFDGSVFRDIRQYIDGEEELCFKKRCNEVNFATFATRVLDEVTYGHRWVIDEGRISDFKVIRVSEKFAINYLNEAGNNRTIEFLPRDIGIDGKISSIDSLILEATKEPIGERKESRLKKDFPKWSLGSVIFKIVKFLIFLILTLVPGFLLLNKVVKDRPIYQKLSISLILGLVLFTLVFYLLALFKIKQLIFFYLFINFIIFIKYHKQFLPSRIDKGFNLAAFGVIILGTIFQQLPSFKNGLNFPYGLGFWGPNSHDGLWHVSLINQLTKAVPPQNPIFAGEVLKNYHYFFDLLVAATNYVSAVPVLDLLFRFYPVTFSLSLGIGSYYLIKLMLGKITDSRVDKLAILFGIYLVYFAGSFGWIVEYIKFKHLGGESAFWANQSISFNLNPPFAISLLVVIAIFQLLFINRFSKIMLFILTILSATLIAFKAYAAVLILMTFLWVGVIKRSAFYLLTFLTGSILSAILFFSNFSLGKQLIIFSPFWFIHSMVDSPDRVGWIRLSLARTAGLEQGNWFKFVVSEIISFLIFLIGNLGTRAFALLALLKIKHIVRRAEYLFIFVFSTLAFIIPILFVQAGNPWNTIQFMYYFLYIAALLGGIVFAKIVSVNKIFSVPIMAIFLLITPINSWATANGYLNYQPHALVSNQELEALNFLKSKKEGIVLTYPFDEKLKVRLAEPWPLYAYDSTAYVSALSEKSIFVEDEPQNQILLTDYKKRLSLATEFFQSKDFKWSKDFLIQNNIEYIYIPKMFDLLLDENKLNLKNIFENSEVIIHETL